MTQLQRFKELLTECKVHFTEEIRTDGWVIMIPSDTWPRSEYPDCINDGYWGFYNKIEFDEHGTMKRWVIAE